MQAMRFKTLLPTFLLVIAAAVVVFGISRNQRRGHGEDADQVRNQAAQLVIRERTVMVVANGQNRSDPGRSEMMRYVLLVQNGGTKAINRLLLETIVRKPDGALLNGGTPWSATLIAPGETTVVEFQIPMNGDPALYEKAEIRIKAAFGE